MGEFEHTELFSTEKLSAEDLTRHNLWEVDRDFEFIKKSLFTLSNLNKKAEESPFFTWRFNFCKELNFFLAQQDLSEKLHLLNDSERAFLSTLQAHLELAPYSDQEICVYERLEFLKRRLVQLRRRFFWNRVKNFFSFQYLRVPSELTEKMNFSITKILEEINKKQKAIPASALTRLKLLAKDNVFFETDVLLEFLRIAQKGNLLPENHEVAPLGCAEMKKEVFLYFHEIILRYGTSEQKKELFKLPWYEVDPNNFIDVHPVFGGIHLDFSGYENIFKNHMLKDCFFEIVKINLLSKKMEEEISEILQKNLLNPESLNVIFSQGEKLSEAFKALTKKISANKISGIMALFFRKKNKQSDILVTLIKGKKSFFFKKIFKNVGKIMESCIDNAKRSNGIKIENIEKEANTFLEYLEKYKDSEKDRDDLEIQAIKDGVMASMIEWKTNIQNEQKKEEELAQEFLFRVIHENRNAAKEIFFSDPKTVKKFSAYEDCRNIFDFSEKCQSLSIKEFAQFRDKFLIDLEKIFFEELATKKELEKIINSLYLLVKSSKDEESFILINGEIKKVLTAPILKNKTSPFSEEMTARLEKIMHFSQICFLSLNESPEKIKFFLLYLEEKNFPRNGKNFLDMLMLNPLSKEYGLIRDFFRESLYRDKNFSTEEIEQHHKEISMQYKKGFFSNSAYICLQLFLYKNNKFFMKTLFSDRKSIKKIFLKEGIKKKGWHRIKFFLFEQQYQLSPTNKNRENLRKKAERFAKYALAEKDKAEALAYVCRGLAPKATKVEENETLFRLAKEALTCSTEEALPLDERGYLRCL